MFSTGKSLNIKLHTSVLQLKSTSRSMFMYYHQKHGDSRHLVPPCLFLVTTAITPGSHTFLQCENGIFWGNNQKPVRVPDGHQSSPTQRHVNVARYMRVMNRGKLCCYKNNCVLRSTPAFYTSLDQVEPVLWFLFGICYPYRGYNSLFLRPGTIKSASRSLTNRGNHVLLVLLTGMLLF